MAGSIVLSDLGEKRTLTSASVRQTKIRSCLVGFIFPTLILLAVCGARIATAQEHLKKFTVADDVELTNFTAPIVFSPDNKYFVVASQRGRLDLNRSESSLRIYSIEHVRRFILNSDATHGPSPVMALSKATYKNGPTITNVRWLSDSTGVAFILKNRSGNDQLFLADIAKKTVRPLTPPDKHVTAFDIRSREQFIYSVLSSKIHEREIQEAQADAIVGTGRSLDSLMFPASSSSPNIWLNDVSEIWAVRHNKQSRVLDPVSGQPVLIHLEGQRALALSPDGRSLVTALTVGIIPREWESMYPPPLPDSPYQIRPRTQDPAALSGQRDVSAYVLVDLAKGTIRALTEAPIGNAAGWTAMVHAAWSADGQSVLLSNTFLSPMAEGANEPIREPCVVVVDLMPNRSTCVERLKREAHGDAEKDWYRIYKARFVGGNKDKVEIGYSRIDNTSGSKILLRSNDGAWLSSSLAPQSTLEDRPLIIEVKQGLNDPPVLTATERKGNRTGLIWDPNPQLKHRWMGEVSIFKWKDKNDRNWVGGLYKPPDYIPGRLYPLVIQTHGFNDRSFSPSGAFTTAFAAQELAAVGFLVLQVRDCPIRSTPEEGPCQVGGYEAAVEQLSKQGLVDPDRVGIIGFSRTCYYVLEALTTSKLRFRAASITDGVNEGYLQYMLDVDSGNDSIRREGDAIIGASPFRAGLKEWLRRSPDFNMDRVTAPLEVMATTSDLLQMWEPYAALRYLNKPVDLLVLRSDEHIFTNPVERLISQGSTVDWFRFWLQDYYEDPSPSKSEQYRRWEAMRPCDDMTQNEPPRL